MKSGAFRCRNMDLPAEILTEVFKYLLPYDELAGCRSYMLVNHAWCDAVIPMIWSKPFELMWPLYRERLLIVRTYLSCLPKAAQERLAAKGISMEDVSESTVYAYPSFLREVHFNGFVYAIEGYLHWLQCKPEPLHSMSWRLRRNKPQEPFPTVMRALLEMFWDYGVELKGFLIADSLMPLDSAYDRTITFKIRFKELFASLVAFELRGNDKVAYDRLFEMLAKSCRKLRTITLVKCFHVTDYLIDGKPVTRLCELIEAQEALEQFCLCKTNVSLQRIIDALASQSHSLTRVWFQDVNFLGCRSWKGLAACTRISEMEFEACNGLTPSMIDPLVSSTDFTRLKRARLLSNYPTNVEYGIVEWAQLQGAEVQKGPDHLLIQAMLKFIHK